MSILHARPIPLYRDPSLWPGLAALSAWLEDAHYSQHAREQIVAHTAAEGTPTGSAYLEGEDLDGATEAFVAALPAVPDDAAAWSDPAVFIDVESLIERDREADRRRLAADPELAAIIRDEPALASVYADCLPPVAGGSPEDDDDPMGFPHARPAPPLPDRLSPEGLAGFGRALAMFDRSR